MPRPPPPPPPPPATDTPLRSSERLYKRRDVRPGLSRALDVLGPWGGAEGDEGGWRGAGEGVRWKWVDLKGRVGERERRGVVFEDHPGLVLLPRHLPPTLQRSLIRSSLSHIPRPPNRTNLHTHYRLPRSLFSLYASKSPEIAARPIAAPGTVVREPSGPRGRVENTAVSEETRGVVWGKGRRMEEAEPSGSVKPLNAEEAMGKLRWCNIGHYYNWVHKQYDFTYRDPHTGGPLPIPSDVHSTCTSIVRHIPWDLVPGIDAATGERWAETYEPDAGIVNYYQLKDTLMAHVDHSELSAELPLVSISLGHAAVFLIGSPIRDDPRAPTAIVLRSGDAVVMSGPARRCFHGVPRILENSLPAHLSPESLDPEEGEGEEDPWEPYGRFMSHARININVRQTGLSKEEIDRIVEEMGGPRPTVRKEEGAGAA